MSRASRSNRAEWLARTEPTPEHEGEARTPNVSSGNDLPDVDVASPRTTPVDPEYERLHLRCPICGEVMESPEHRPYHLALEHGWRLPREFGETVRGIFDEYVWSRRVS